MGGAATTFAGLGGSAAKGRSGIGRLACGMTGPSGTRACISSSESAGVGSSFGVFLRGFFFDDLACFWDLAGDGAGSASTTTDFSLGVGSSASAAISEGANARSKSATE